MKETTEGKWVNRIEELWIATDDKRKSTGERTVVLFNAIAAKISRAMNRIFGPRPISIKMIGVSSSLSFSSLFLVLAATLGFICIVILTNSTTLKPELVRQVPLLMLLDIGFLFLGAVCGLLVLFTVSYKSHLLEWLSCTPAILWAVCMIRFHLLVHTMGNPYGIGAALSISVASDILLLVLIRKSLQWIESDTTLLKMLIALALQALTFVLIFLIPLRLPTAWHPEMAKTMTGQFLFALAMFNLPTVLASLVFGTCVLFVTLHLQFWPFINAVNYVLVRKEVLDKRKTVRLLGFALIIFAIAWDHSLWYFIAQKVMK